MIGTWHKMTRLAANALKFVLFLGLGIGLIWLATHGFSPAQRSEIGQAFRIADYRVLIPALLIGLGSHLIRAARWKLLILPLGYSPSLLNMFCAVMVGYLSNLALPRLGEITRCAVLARYEKIPADQVIGTMIAERAVDALSLVVILVLTLTLQVRVVGHFFFQDILHGKFSLRSWHVLILGLAILVIAIILVWIITARMRHTKLFARIRLWLKGVWDGIRTIGQMTHKGRFLIYTLILWVLYFLMVYIGFYCLKSTSHLGIGAGLSVLAFGSIGMILTQGGIGAYQLLVQRTLTLYGIGSALAYALGWIIWLSQTLLVISVGFICVVLLPVINRKSLGQTADHQP